MQLFQMRPRRHPTASSTESDDFVRAPSAMAPPTVAEDVVQVMQESKASEPHDPSIHEEMQQVIKTILCYETFNVISRGDRRRSDFDHELIFQIYNFHARIRRKKSL